MRLGLKFLTAFLIFFSLLITPLAIAQDDLEQEIKEEEPSTFPVEFEGRKLFIVTTKGDFPARKRSQLIEDKLLKISKNRSLDTKKLEFDHSGKSSFIYIDDEIVFTISERDAQLMGKPRKQYAQAVGKVIVKSINEYRAKRTFWKLLGAFILSILTTFLFLLVIRLFDGIYLRSYGHFKNIKDTLTDKPEIISLGGVSLIIEMLKFIRAIVLFIIFYFYMTLIFKIFPDTRGFEKELNSNLTDFFSNTIAATVNYLPNLILIAFLGISAYYLNRIIKYIFTRIEKSEIVLAGFYPEWANSTSKIIRFLVIVFTFIFVFPLLPGSNSDAFKAVSLFLGAIVSLSSASAVANIIAGVVLTYTRAFKIGDIVKISETIGRITEATLLVTRVRTIKNVSISIPNSLVLGSHIENFSIMSKKKKLIISAGVTIGYDSLWQKVYELLLKAADKTQGTLKDPKPFVLQRSLENSYVAYELNVYIDEPERILFTYSNLYENIQDVFNQAGVEIMSTENISVRDGNESTIPKEKPFKEVKE